MKVTRCAIPGVLVLHAESHADPRGLSAELWSETELPTYGNTGVDWRLAITQSSQWAVRGLHYQLPVPSTLGGDVEVLHKVVTCLRGVVLDVLVDLRLRSPAFGRHARIELSGVSAEVISVFVPSGVAHGYVVQSPHALMINAFSNRHEPELDRSLRWNDPALGIDWGLPHGAEPILSERDASAPTLDQYISGTDVFDTGTV